MSRYRRLSPFTRQEFRDVEGDHADEEDFGIFDEVCPPGRINEFTSPPTYRMRLQIGRYWDSSRAGYVNMGPTTDLINQYKTKLSQGKVVAQGKGFEPYRWGYKWPPNVINQARYAESRGLPMNPFLDLLLKPEAERPSNLRECIDFFYPLSGSIPPDTDISPFVSTAISAYYVPNADPNNAGNIPLELGEVSMMYGWYLVWKMILCPLEYHNNIAIFTSSASHDADFPFQRVGGDILLNTNLRKSVQDAASEEIANLARISDAVGAVTKIASAAVSSGIGMPEDLAEVSRLASEVLGINSDNWKEEILHKYGTAYVASTLAEYVEIPYTHLNDLASVVVNGAMSEDKWAALKSDAEIAISSAKQRAARATKQIAQKYVTDRLASFAGGDIALAKSITSILDDFMITGIPSTELSKRVDSIRNKAVSQRDAVDKAILRAYEVKSEEVAYRTKRLLEDFSRYGDARTNPEPISTAVYGIILAGKLIQGGIGYHQAKIAKGSAKVSKYLTDNLYRLDPLLQAGEASFDLSRHIRQGFWYDGEWYSGAVKPDCALQQGGQVLDYWIHVWSRAHDVIFRFDCDRTEAEETTGGIEGLRGAFGQFPFRKYFRKSSVGEGYPAYGYSQNGNRPRKETYRREESKVREGYSRCQGLGVLAKHTDSSMRMVLDNMDLFSPFTHAYGFAPTAQLRTDGKIFIDGTSPRRYLGRSNFNTRSDGQARASSAPGRLFPSMRIDLKNAYGPHGVECWARKSPLPSRRLLEGVYGQRCNISFDVGLDPQIPVMGAQFAGLMACLLSHPEALETCI